MLGHPDPMAHLIYLDVSTATYEDLYRFVDHARAAFVPGERRVTLDPTSGPVITANLGEVDHLSRPVLLDRRDLDRYTNALERELAQESDRNDTEVLRTQ